LDNITTKSTTGFPNVMAMLLFIVIINEGDAEKIKHTVSKLTWLEEYLLYFEVMYSRQHTRWIDVCNKYKITDPLARKIFDSKISKQKKP
jgi:hypothetical protein